MGADGKEYGKAQSISHQKYLKHLVDGKHHCETTATMARKSCKNLNEERIPAIKILSCWVPTGYDTS